jgi:predicted O-linked N-acetylglucosamine transferase (SPINDLY family)
MAVRLAFNGSELAALRGRLAAQRLTAPLFDTQAFARNLEAAYWKMWQNQANGRPPARIELP